MRKAMVASALVLASCSGRGEIIPTPSPAPELPTTAEAINSAALVPDPTTTATATPTTTEPAPTMVPTVPRRPTTTAQYLQPEATTASGIDYSLPYEGWAIPKYIVSCETGGTFDWYAYNPSGASGPYQLMPLHFGGELAMNQPRSAQHAKAAELWNGGRGKSHWRDCL